MEKVKTKSFELAIYAKGDLNSEKLAIIVPGRLDTKDYFHNTSLVDYLSEKGYFALSFDPPGIWESSGKIEIYTTTNCIKAVDELIEHFGNKPSFLAGHSRGGTIAMLAGPKNPNVTHFVSIFSYYGKPSGPKKEKIVNNKVISYRDLPPGKNRTKKQKEFGLPLSYFEDGKQYNALPSLRDCKKPKLFFYGTHDEFTDEEDVRKAYKESSEPKMIYGVNAVHNYRLQPKIVKEINNIIGHFLDTYPI